MQRTTGKKLMLLSVQNLGDLSCHVSLSAAVTHSKKGPTKCPPAVPDHLVLPRRPAPP